VHDDASLAEPDLTDGDVIALLSDRIALGDYSGALEQAEALLAREADGTTDLALRHPPHPNHLDRVRSIVEQCRATLEKMYITHIGSLHHVPVVLVARDQVRWLTIDHRAGFLMSVIDGVSDVETVLDVCGMPRFDALRILSELTQQRIVGWQAKRVGH